MNNQSLLHGVVHSKWDEAKGLREREVEHTVKFNNAQGEAADPLDLNNNHMEVTRRQRSLEDRRRIMEDRRKSTYSQGYCLNLHFISFVFVLVL